MQIASSVSSRICRSPSASNPQPLQPTFRSRPMLVAPISLCSAQLRWLHHMQIDLRIYARVSFFFSLLFAVCVQKQNCTLIISSAILECATGDYPWWLSMCAAVLLVVADVAENMSGIQLWKQSFELAYAARSALSGLIFDKVRTQDCGYDRIHKSCCRCFDSQPTLKRQLRSALSSIM